LSNSFRARWLWRFSCARSSFCNCGLRLAWTNASSESVHSDLTWEIGIVID
jgi:hypothetical protein